MILSQTHFFKIETHLRNEHNLATLSKLHCETFYYPTKLSSICMETLNECRILSHCNSPKKNKQLRKYMRAFKEGKCW